MTATFTTKASVSSLRAQILMDRQAKLEIGERIRELRDGSVETNRSIGDYVGVGERSVARWVAGDGISYGHATKVAELFQVDADWLWRGKEKGPTPDPFSAPSSSESDLLRQTVAEIDQKLDRVLALVAELALEQARKER